MIRKEAAAQCAANIFDAVSAAMFAPATAQMIETAGTLIEASCKIDELAQQIEILNQTNRRRPHESVSESPAD